MKATPILVSVVLAAASALILGCSHRAKAEEAGPALPSVPVETIGRRDLFKEVTIQAEFRPYQEVELHAKVAGYLRDITVDFGDHVKAGQLIAVLEVPELKDQLDNALAGEQRATADARLANLDYTRLAGVARSQPNLVAQQDIDAAEAKYQMAAAAAAAAKAEADRYQTLDAYTRITAPFDGVVTARYADPGALIQTGSSSDTQTLPLVRISENQLLRLDFPVSVTYAGEIRVGDPVVIKLGDTGRILRAPITRFSRRIMTDTRTMETEVEVPNPKLTLIPGMYATAVLHLQRRPNALALPVEAVGSGENPTVDRVGPDDRIEECPVKLGIESPEYYEVLSGLSPGDRVVVGSRAGLEPGEKVLPTTVETNEQP